MKKIVENLINTLKGKEITILGHDNIDVDAVLSGILLSELLDFLNIKNRFCIIETVKEDDTYKIVDKLIGINIKDWQENNEYETRNLFLVDHYETIHKGQVIGCIDHHPTHQQKAYNFMYVRNSCATAYLIYEIMKIVNFPISEKHAKMIIMAMMVDTISFRSSKTINQEVIIAKELAETYNIDFDFFERYCLCLTEIDKMPVKEIISNGQKWYNYNSHKVGSSYLQLYGLPENMIEIWLEALDKKRKETNSEMLVFLIFETQNNITYEYRIMNNCIKKIEHKGILSRGKDIMPLVEKRYLES